MKPLGFLLVLCIIGTGYCISCKSCWHMRNDPCTGSSVPCEANQVCVAFLTVETAGTDAYTYYMLRCGSPSECNVNGSMTYDKGIVKTSTSCCDTDNCMPPFPNLPEVSSQKNGLKCNICSSDNSNYCNSTETMECTGDEMKCGIMGRNLTGRVLLTDAYRGCATRSYCEILGNQAVTVQGIQFDVKMSCNDASALHVGLLGCALAILLTELIF